MIFFESFRVQVLDKWQSFAENFAISSDDFYEKIEKELEVRKVPGLTIERIQWEEGGVLSANREYLRLTREKWVFDICAAPFGTGYFFSYRFTELPANFFALVALIGSILVALIALSIFVKIFGYLFGFPLFLVATLFLFWFLRNSKKVGIDLDSKLLQLPIVGSLYERFFRRDTYYREDTRSMYLATVPAIVKKLAEEVTAEKGVQEPKMTGKPVLPELADVV